LETSLVLKRNWLAWYALLVSLICFISKCYSILNIIRCTKQLHLEEKCTILRNLNSKYWWALIHFDIRKSFV
jgi:hypothetical protein